MKWNLLDSFRKKELKRTRQNVENSYKQKKSKNDEITNDVEEVEEMEEEDSPNKHDILISAKMLKQLKGKPKTFRYSMNTHHASFYTDYSLN